MTSSSSEDEAMNEVLKESANCDYINELTNPSKNRPNGNRPSKRSVDENVTKNDFEFFLAQRLASRLDESIKIVEKKSSKPSNSQKSSGIQLFSKAPTVQELQNDEVTVIVQKKKQEIDVDYERLANAVAVSPEWVASKENTAHWKDGKRQRILKTKVVKNLPNGGVECSPLEN